MYRYIGRAGGHADHRPPRPRQAAALLANTT